MYVMYVYLIYTWFQYQTKTSQGEKTTTTTTTLQTSISYEYRCKILQRIVTNKIRQHIRRIIHYDQVEFIYLQRMQGWFTISEFMNIISSFQLLLMSNSLWPIDWSMPGFPVHHQLPELAQAHVHQVGDAIQPSCPLSSPSPPAFSLS